MSDTSLKLLRPVELGRLRLANRVVMAPLTRGRALPGGRCNASAALYYAQRATAGLIVSEAVCISAQAVGAPGVPGIWTDEQVASWKRVTEAVHARGGRMVTQLWHTGRGSHPLVQEGGQLPVGPSAIAIEGDIFTPRGLLPHVTPRALETEEIPGIVEQYARAAEHALRAGCDGVELHGGNGYLIDQFLHDSSNQRPDRYGGSIQNRARLLFEIVRAVSEVCGSGRVGVRISPSSTWQDMYDSDPAALYGHVLSDLSGYGLAYLHLVEPGIVDDTVEGAPQTLDSAWARKLYAGPLIAAGEYDRERAEDALTGGRADAIAFGRLFLANPDLPQRLAERSPLNLGHRSSFYGGDDQGYLDYPSLAAERIHEDLRKRLIAREPHALPDIQPLDAQTPFDFWPLAWAVQRLHEDGIEDDGTADLAPGTLIEVLQARAVFELGLAWHITRRVSDADASALRQRADALLSFMSDERYRDLDGYLRANEAYHEGLIGLVHNEPLLTAFRSLNLRARLAEALGGTTRANDDLLRVHERLTAAVIASDFNGAREAILTHAELSTERVRAATGDSADGHPATPSREASPPAFAGEAIPVGPSPDQLVETSPNDSGDAIAAMRAAIEARAILETGATQWLGGAPGEREGERLRERVAALAPLIEGERFVDVASYVAANSAFHELFVGMLGNTALQRASRSLDVPNLMVRALTRNSPTRREIVEDYRLQVQALVNGQVEATCQAIAAYSRRVREIHATHPDVRRAGTGVPGRPDALRPGS